MNYPDRDMRKKPWEDWIPLLAGAWLVASPWLLSNIEREPSTLYDVLIVGLALVLASGANLIKEERRVSLVNLVLGVWAIASPWILHFWGDRDIAVSTAVSGAVVAVVSLLQMAKHYNLRDRLMQ